MLDEERLSSAEQVAALSAEDLDRLFADGRKNVAGEFVAVDIDKVVTARLGRKKPPLKVLWGQYLKSEAVGVPGSTGMSGSARSSPSTCGSMI